jgi:hypothetical protein
VRIAATADTPGRNLGWACSLVAVAAGGALLVAAALQPFIVLDGESTAAIREGGLGSPDGALAAILLASGIAAIVLALLVVVLSRHHLRLIHCAVAPVGAVILGGLVHARAAGIEESVRIYAATYHPAMSTAAGVGIGVAYAGLAVLVAAPAFAARQILQLRRA